MTRKNGLKNKVLYNLAVIFLYIVTGLGGLVLAVTPGYATAIWLPSGLALGFVLVFGLSTLPGIFIASFILDFYVTYSNSGHLFSFLNVTIGLITGSGAVLQALTGWWLVKRFVSLSSPLHFPKDILFFALLSGPISCVVAATISNMGLYLIGIISTDNLLINWFTWWIGDSMGVLIFTPVFLILFAKPRTLWRSRVTPIMLPLCATFFIVFFAHLFFSQIALKHVQEKFSTVTEHKLNQLNEEIKLIMKSTKVISFAFVSQPTVDKEMFLHQGSILLQENPIIQSIQWVPKIINRDAFEKQYHLKLVDRQSSVHDKLWYYPIVSQKETIFPTGYNLSSNPDFVKNLNFNVGSDSPVFILLTKNNKVERTFIASAIYKNSELTGFIVLQFDFMKLVNEIFNNFENYSSLTINNSSENKNPIIIYKNNIPNGSAQRVHDSVNYQLAGTTWQINAVPSTIFMNQEYSWQIWLSLTETLFFCVLMNIILFILYGQRYLIQYVIDAKNIQLQTEKAKNLLLLNAAGEGILWIDTEYNITFINPAAEKLLGYSSDELKNESINSILDEKIVKVPFCSIENTAVYHAIQEKTIIKAKEVVFWKKDHSCFWVEYTCIPIILNDEVKGAAVIFSDITERLENEIKLMNMAHFDPLTKLPNRLSFFEYLEHALARAHRNKAQFAVCFLDVDNFKYINDSYGHVYGDQILIALPKIITPHLRDTDYFARLGGDEFGLIIEDTHKLNDMAKIFERIIATFDAPIKVEDQYIKTAISIGVALYPENGCDSEALFKNADIAMYHAKKMGKSTFSFFCEKANEEVLKVHHIESALLDAINQKRYQVYYQPIMNTINNKILGVEARIRWSDEVLKEFSQEDSLLIAEDKGFIYELGKLILEQAFKEFHSIAKSEADIYLAINISRKQIENLAFTQLIQSLVKRYEIDPKQIYFEISEISLIHDSERTINIMTELNTLGIEFALDDFGIGYSSIHLLKKLPISFIKIDQSFVRDLEHNVDDDAAVFIQTTIQLSSALSIKTIADGVENHNQICLLNKWGCTMIQGNYFASPMLLADLLEWMQKDEEIISAISSQSTQ
ncbi:EAL domain-containing protein [Legionella fallonii]|uniref:Sensory box/GGDEF domain-containing protein (Modular protein) n=1 Tax=Legionella fallonii LLAP-10 TaxID=1212491 RepID=A0A098G5E9_9GAMM|nr:EAL domain-containing protein [Legionella fallonii]CEG57206.1 Sensory box/GGDEF domain-containing protein (modular protein) [Legionella fallonii LLAP-10]